MFTKLILSTAILASSFAHADIVTRPVPTVLQSERTAKITQADLDPAVLGNYLFNGGLLTVTEHNHTPVQVSLFIDREKNCAPGAICTMEMVMPLTVELPVKSVTSGECGAKIITAQYDARPADGEFQQIVITDNSMNLCNIYMEFATTATYTTKSWSRMGGSERVTTSHLRGELLK